VAAPLVLLDLDGTLMDSAPGITESARYAFEKLGFPVPSDEVLRSFVGPPITESFPAHGIPADRFADALAAYREFYTATGMWDNSVYDGIPEQLARLREAGCTLIIATAKPELFAVQICERFGLTSLVDAIFGNTLDEGFTKADIIAAAMASVDHVGSGAPVVMVGDREHDVHGATEHGVACIGAAWGYAAPGELLREGAIKVVEDVSDLADVVLETLHDGSRVAGIGSG